MAFYNDRQEENWKKQITHRHVHNQKVDTVPHGFRLVDKYSDEGISKQRGNKNQAVGKCFSDLFGGKTTRTEAIRKRCSFQHTRRVCVNRHSQILY